MAMLTRPLQLLRKTLSLAQPGALGLKPGRCPTCGPTLMVKLADDAISVRCIRCRSSAIHMSMLQVLQRLYPDLSSLAVYEMSSRGPVFSFLRARVGQFAYSEFFDDVQPGTLKNGIQCQDVQALTFGDASFDLCTSTEVFEHVPDDHRGFSEIRRVLRPGGRFVFTVPLTDNAATVERAVIEGGTIRHLLEPEYHGDVIRGHGMVLAFRNYGLDIVDRLKAGGFGTVRLEPPDRAAWWGFGTKVVVAEV